MKTCELKFPPGSLPNYLEKYFWMKISDPSLSLILILNIQLWMKP